MGAMAQIIQISQRSGDVILDDADKGWHLDRKVPLSIIAMLLLQFVAGIWWVSNSEARLNAVVAAVEAQDKRLSHVETGAQDQRVTLAAVTEQLTALKQAMDQMRQDQRETNDLLRQVLGAKK